MPASSAYIESDTIERSLQPQASDAGNVVDLDCGVPREHYGRR